MTMDEWFKGPQIHTTIDLYKALVNAMHAVPPVMRNDATRWVMNREWYSRIRAMAMTEEQEIIRALSHARAVVPVLATFPLRCPACTRGPFATMDDLRAHVKAMADPFNRDPEPGDTLLGIVVEVTADGGVPHIENKHYPADAARLPHRRRHRRLVPRQPVDRPPLGTRRQVAPSRHASRPLPRRRRAADLRPAPWRPRDAAPRQQVQDGTMSDSIARVRELHRPRWYNPYTSSGQVWLVCHGCDEGAHAETPASWPCSTAEIVYSAEEIVAREPQVAECPVPGHRRPDGQSYQPQAVFIRHHRGPLLAARWKCDHVTPVPVDPVDPWE